MPNSSDRGHTMPGAFLLVMLACTTIACGARGAQSWARTMPSPEGCFVQVWNRPGFAGNSDYINGPIQYPHLRDLPKRRSWKDQIGSLKLGPAVSATAWSQEQFGGRSLLLTSDSRERGAFATLPLKIESLDLRCASQAVAETR